MRAAPILVVDKDDYWICACVRRKGGRLTHIKGNHPSVKKCRKCGCTKDESEREQRELSGDSTKWRGNQP